MKLPFISRKKYHEDLTRQSELYEGRLKREKELREQQTSQIDELLPRLSRVNIDRSSYDRMFRISIMMDEALIHQVFTWGNSEQNIRVIAERMGYEIARELSGINASRLVRHQSEAWIQNWDGTVTPYE